MSDLNKIVTVANDNFVAEEQKKVVGGDSSPNTTLNNVNSVYAAQLKPITMDDILAGCIFTPEQIKDLEEKIANDNWPDLPSDPNELQKLWVNIQQKVIADSQQSTGIMADTVFKQQQLLAQRHAAQKLMVEYGIGVNLNKIDQNHGLKKTSKKRQKDGKLTKKDIINRDYPSLGPSVIRYIPKLELSNVITAIQESWEKGEVVTRSDALSQKTKNSARAKKQKTPFDNFKNNENDYASQIINRHFDKPIKVASLFANIGVGTSLLDTMNAHVVLVNELRKERAQAHKRLYPNAECIIGDISHPDILSQVTESFKRQQCDVLLMSPPCQQSSRNNTSENKGNTEEALGFKFAIDAIKAIDSPRVIIENVPEWLPDCPQIALNRGILKEGDTIGGYVMKALESLGYNVTLGILNASHYGTAQARVRAFILACKKEFGTWKLPAKHEFCPLLMDVIRDLKSLGRDEVDPDNKWHYALHVEDHEFEFLSHTPTARCAWDNKQEFQPKNKSGSASQAQFKAGFTRLDWQKPGKTLTSGSDNLSNTHSIHPGRLLSSGLYSDARVLSILELLRITGAKDDFLDPLIPKGITPDDFPGLTFGTDNRLISKDEDFIRTVIGEQVCPKMMNALFSTMPIDKVESEAES